MYDEHDRPSTLRMIVTIAGVVAGIAALVAIAAVVFGMSTSNLTNGSSTTASSGAQIAQAPATATAQVDNSQPAKTSAVTTADVSSDPLAGASGTSGDTTATKGATAGAATTPVVTSGLTVVIDAGHQGTLDTGTEPNHPGPNAPMKMKVAGGATGVATHTEESLRNLQVALVLQKSLEARGVHVVMVRTTQNVDISNKRRAEIANENNAALFIRLHCDSAASSVTGILTLRPAKNWYGNADIVTPSKTAATDVQSAVLATTGAHDRGITPRSDETGFNWCKVPCVLVEMGLMSNPAEDRKMATAAYQAKLAEGMANGIVTFLKSR